MNSNFVRSGNQSRCRIVNGEGRGKIRSHRASFLRKGRITGNRILSAGHGVGDPTTAAPKSVWIPCLLAACAAALVTAIFVRVARPNFPAVSGRVVPELQESALDGKQIGSGPTPTRSF
jgi:hypothetical protein